MSGGGEYMDIAEFRDAGYLQEINRRVLHPAGLALAVSMPWTVDDLAELIEPAGLSLTSDQLAALHKVLAYDRWTLTGVVDVRDDPEGMIYGDGMIEPAKAASVDAEIDRHAADRLVRCGFIVQPVPDVAPEPIDDSTIAGDRTA